MAAVTHALEALGDFIVDDEWLAGRVAALRAILADRSLDEVAQTARVEEALAAIEHGRPAVVARLHAGVAALRATIAHAVAEVDELSQSISRTHVDLDRYEKLALGCKGVEDAREIIAMLTADMRRLQSAVEAKGVNTERCGSLVREQLGSVQPPRVVVPFQRRPTA